MSNRVERLRVYLLGSAIFLLLVIGAFIGMARYLRGHFLGQLPAKLGVNIVRETNGYTYSQSVQGRTVYSIHAAKAIEHTDGKIGLHDVSITLYGKKGDRADRIYGDEFEYDKNAEVIRAAGVVHIDLQSAEDARRGAAAAKVMHVTTSGLVYLQKLGLAATSAPIEFAGGGITGHAVGADYASDSGVLILHSAVDMSGSRSGNPVALTAATAQFDDHNQEAYLTHATYESEGKKAAADEATLYRRVDGTLSRVVGKGNVTITEKGATVVAQQADVALTVASQPQTAVLTGAVKYMSDSPLRQMRGQADAATIAFDQQAKPQPAHVVLTGAVHLTERTRVTDAAKEPWSTRDLTAAHLVAVLAPVGGSGNAELQDATATGNPRLIVVDNGSLASSAGEGTTELAADTLSTHLVAAVGGKQPQVDTISGRGNTLLRQITMTGMQQTIAADTLDAKLRPMPAAGAAKTGTGAAGEKLAESLWSSVQQGHVMMTRRIPARPAPNAASRLSGSEDVEHAFADRAVYDGDLDRMTLSGGVQVSDAGSVLWANQVALDRKTGDSHAVGGVKVSYVEQPVAGAVARSGAQQAEPTHVLADRADFNHTADVATFYGKPVRMWQGGNQVQAPVIELANAQKRLVARADAAGALGGMQVHTVLAGGGSGAASMDRGSSPGVAKVSSGAAPCASTAKMGAAAGGSPAGAQTPAASAVRIASGGLTYSGATGQADFTSGFRADTEDGTIRAAEGVAYLRQTSVSGDGGENAGAEPALSGNLDRIVATGRVQLNNSGVKATGERLVYTASDRTAVLTGDAKAPPKAVGAEGTTTGEELLFRSACDGGGSVEVLGAPGQRVHTDVRMSDDGKKEKGKR